MSALESQVGGGHYKDLAIQPVEYMHANGIPFIEGCIIKYATRWRDKGGIQDLDKIKHFAQLLIDLELRAQAEPQRHPMTPNVLEFDEARADAIGQNGNDGEHYGQDMTDPRNWRAGDWVKVIKDCRNGISVGAFHRIETDPYYDVNHLLVNGVSFMLDAEWLRFHARPDADGWIEHDGRDESPVGDAVRVDVQTEHTGDTNRSAGNTVWSLVRRYRPHLATKQDKG